MAPPDALARAAPDLDAKVAFLRRPAAYPHRPETVEAIETHMAFVFLADDLAYKLKKPVRHAYLDFSTVARREQVCRDEVRLNRRLAPDVYLGVAPLIRRPDGPLALAADPPPPGADVVDWLVRMRRLPAARMLDRAIAAGSATAQDIDRVGDVLARFYAAAPAAELPAEAFAERFARDHAATAAVLRDGRFAQDCAQAAAVLTAFERALAAARPALARRVEQHRVVEGHGDLRPEHVCLIDPPVVIDCLEFDRTLRLVDPYEELAFLGLECALLGASWVGPRLLDRCRPALGGIAAPLPDLYLAHRALLRARLALAHLMEPSPREPQKWAPQAQRYIEAARTALEHAST